MPAPASVPELLDRLRKSRLVPGDRLDGFVAVLETAGGKDPIANLLPAIRSTPEAKGQRPEST